MKDLIELIARKLVTHPEDVQTTLTETEEGQVIALRVNPEDMGRVIGKSGKTAKAIRTVLSAASSKADTRVSLQIVE